MLLCFFSLKNILLSSIISQDELETHSKPESISIFIHYGGDRTNDPKVISEHDVVLTTYGVLTSAYKNVRITVFHDDHLLPLLNQQNPFIPILVCLFLHLACLFMFSI